MRTRELIEEKSNIPDFNCKSYTVAVYEKA
jgi:hypothetical protein